MRSLNASSTATRFEPAEPIASCKDELLLTRRSITSVISAPNLALASTSALIDSAAPASTEERRCAEERSIAVVSSFCLAPRCCVIAAPRFSMVLRDEVADIGHFLGDLVAARR